MDSVQESSCLSVASKKEGRRNGHAERNVVVGLNNFKIIYVDTEISNKAVELIEKYSKSHGLEPPDALIGATAIVRNIELFTYNIGDFRFIDGLKLYRF